MGTSFTCSVHGRGHFFYGICSIDGRAHGMCSWNSHLLAALNFSFPVSQTLIQTVTTLIRADPPLM